MATQAHVVQEPTAPARAPSRNVRSSLFLDIPLELRLPIYAHLPLHPVTLYVAHEPRDHTERSPANILGVCRLLRSEVLDFWDGKIPVAYFAANERDFILRQEQGTGGPTPPPNLSPSSFDFASIEKLVLGLSHPQVEKLLNSAPAAPLIKLLPTLQELAWETDCKSICKRLKASRAQLEASELTRNEQLKHLITRSNCYEDYYMGKKVTPHLYHSDLRDLARLAPNPRPKRALIYAWVMPNEGRQDRTTLKMRIDVFERRLEVRLGNTWYNVPQQAWRRR